MALEYVVVGRRPVPRSPGRDPWTYDFEIAADAIDDSLDDAFEDGDCAIEELDSTQDEVWSWAEGHAGFKPRSVITIRKAGWEFSQAAAEVLSAALDGIYFVDGLVDEHGIERPFEKAEPAKSTSELERRIEIASTQASKYFEAWENAAKRAAVEWERRNPESAALRKRENDWSDL